MRIYANRETPKLEDFIGQDIWVRCYLVDDGYDAYVKFWERSTNNPDWVTYSIYGADFLDDHDLGMASRREALEELEYEFLDRIANFELCLPVDAYTTEEILEIINDSSEPF